MIDSPPEPGASAVPAAAPRDDQDHSTVGTGSAVAIGCTAATLVLLLAGIGLVVVLRML